MNKFSFIKKFLTPKIIFVILGIVILVEITLAIKNLMTPVARSNPPPKIADTAAMLSPGKISLKLNKNTFTLAEEVPLVVEVNSGGHQVSGVDVIIQYDPKILQAGNEDLLKGTLFEDYPLLSVDEKKGLISISGITRTQGGIAVSGQFARINLKARAAGKTSLKVDFQKDTTTHSNLIESSTLSNILEQVENLELEVK